MNITDYLADPQIQDIARGAASGLVVGATATSLVAHSLYKRISGRPEPGVFYSARFTPSNIRKLKNEGRELSVAVLTRDDSEDDDYLPRDRNTIYKFNLQFKGGVTGGIKLRTKDAADLLRGINGNASSMDVIVHQIGSETIAVSPLKE